MGQGFAGLLERAGGDEVGRVHEGGIVPFPDDKRTGFGSQGPWLDGLYFASSGPVAQSVEQRIENPCVGGSIPPRATKIEKTTFGWFFYLWVIMRADLGGLIVNRHINHYRHSCRHTH